MSRLLLPHCPLLLWLTPASAGPRRAASRSLVSRLRLVDHGGPALGPWLPGPLTTRLGSGCGRRLSCASGEDGGTQGGDKGTRGRGWGVFSWERSRLDVNASPQKGRGEEGGGGEVRTRAWPWCRRRGDDRVWLASIVRDVWGEGRGSQQQQQQQRYTKNNVTQQQCFTQKTTMLHKTTTFHEKPYTKRRFRKRYTTTTTFLEKHFTRNNVTQQQQQCFTQNNNNVTQNNVSQKTLHIMTTRTFKKTFQKTTFDKFNTFLECLHLSLFMFTVDIFIYCLHNSVLL